MKFVKVHCTPMCSSVMFCAKLNILETHISELSAILPSYSVTHCTSLTVHITTFVLEKWTLKIKTAYSSLPPSRHCSRLAPVVYGFRTLPPTYLPSSVRSSGTRIGTGTDSAILPPNSLAVGEDICNRDGDSTLHNTSQILVSCMKKAESEAQLLGFWG